MGLGLSGSICGAHYWMRIRADSGQKAASPIGDLNLEQPKEKQSKLCFALSNLRK
jgi:hypothetical protein